VDYNLYLADRKFIMWKHNQKSRWRLLGNFIQEAILFEPKCLPKGRRGESLKQLSIYRKYICLKRLGNFKRTLFIVSSRKKIWMEFSFGTLI
jgi:hypothetical protein